MLTKAWAVFVAVVALLVPVLAFAQKPVTVHVIALDSDDASEDQADALTAAMRQRVRNAPSLQLAESNQSLATLLPALKCPTRPDSACLQRIGDQLKTDRFFWGNVVKATIAHQVVAEVHLWTRGKPEQVAKETYSDNLKDQNDDALKRIAGQLFERLTGQATQGTIIVHAVGAPAGTVLVDGKAAQPLDHGQATLLLTSGSHSIDVQADGMTTTAQTVNVVVNATNEITFELRAAAVAVPTPSGPAHTKRTIGFVLLGVGGAALIAGAVMGSLYFAGSDASTYNDWFNKNKANILGNACSNASPQTQQIPGQLAACNARSSADTFGSVGWAMMGGGVALVTVGVILAMTDRNQEGAPASSSAGKLRIVPSFGPNGGGVTALLTF
jgi:hypothetical protein